eukprot:CAMPEP_0119403504 /NCGR_PEP_ID=MMETSP1334-20130426/143419_1 /TAXON_ID=127549 /ORGANISM="Calcidiscus leptoporus, Strain RCC1130" /LENGTH=95 /DNA_ID=CAMNT_0007427451 /DNA_START=293 /DNA_END=580 /DNA_ORIENTATION=-
MTPAASASSRESSGISALPTCSRSPLAADLADAVLRAPLDLLAPLMRHESSTQSTGRAPSPNISSARSATCSASSRRVVTCDTPMRDLPCHGPPM